jgi:hypothetical protein
MSNLRETLRDLVRNLSEENYDESLAKYRFWLDVGDAHGHIRQDQVDDMGQILRPDPLIMSDLYHPTAYLFVRLIGDVEVDRKFSEYASGLRRRALYSFFEANLSIMRSEDCGEIQSFLTNATLIALWANTGHVEEETIRNRILQSLIDNTYPKLHGHQADALIILLQTAGVTFEAYAGTSVVDRCLELLKDHHHAIRKWESVLVRALRVVKSGHRVQTSFQGIIGSRECGWGGRHPPSVFTAGKPKPPGANQKDPAATPVITSLESPSKDLEPQVSHSPPLEPVVIPEPTTFPRSPRSPSISIAIQSDFTISGTSDDETPLDPTDVHPHDTFYLEDGNVEVLCANTLFRVHTSALSFHSPVLGQMFAKANLATAESPNGCPRILSSDTARGFATLLKIVYLPGHAVPPPCQWIIPLTISVHRFPERDFVPDFITFSSLLRMVAKYEMPTIRSQLLDIVRNAYPETFEDLDSSKALGESVFSGPTPHPNAVLNLFIRQKLTSALPMAYYMAVRRGLDPLMDRRLPRNAMLAPEILQVAIKGLLALREMELKETHRLIFGSNGSRSCSRLSCPSPNRTGPRISEAHQKIADRITDSARSGTNLLQVLSLKEVCGGDLLGFCERCVEGWEVGHADVRKNAWVVLPDVFGLEG